MGAWRFRPITAADAAGIAGWRYAGPWAVYDSDPEAVPPDPDLRVHAVLEGERLVGFCSFGRDGRVPGLAYDDTAVDVGAGMAPELVGRGRGSGFLRAIVDFARDELGLDDLRCTIAAWNERALRAARSAGFTELERRTTPDGREFVLLLRPPRSTGAAG